MKLDSDFAKLVLGIVDHGLVSGEGVPVPGQMCVEAAVCYALGQSHSDQPSCVAEADRSLKIATNDHDGWRSEEDRAKGLRKIAVYQLGTKSGGKRTKFTREVARNLTRNLLPYMAKRLGVVDKDVDRLIRACVAKPSSRSLRALINHIVNSVDFANDLAGIAHLLRNCFVQPKKQLVCYDIVGFIEATPHEPQAVQLIVKSLEQAYETTGSHGVKLWNQLTKDQRAWRKNIKLAEKFQADRESEENENYDEGYE